MNLERTCQELRWGDGTLSKSLSEKNKMKQQLLCFLWWANEWSPASCELVTFDLPIMKEIYVRDFIPMLHQCLVPGKQQTLMELLWKWLQTFSQKRVKGRQLLVRSRVKPWPREACSISTCRTGYYLSTLDDGRGWGCPLADKLLKTIWNNGGIYNERNKA